MKRISTTCFVALSALSFKSASAATLVSGGSTSVLLDTDLLEVAAGLTLSGAPGSSPGSLPGSVAFSIQGAGDLNPSTFDYEAGSFPMAGTFSGVINHSGSVLFNNDSVEVGDFTIGFDASRAAGDVTGFFVESTTGIEAVLFDTELVTLQSQTDGLLDFTVDLVVSPEFGAFLRDNGLSQSDLTGTDVGDANIQAIPEPSAMSALIIAGLFGSFRRRRRS